MRIRSSSLSFFGLTLPGVLGVIALLSPLGSLLRTHHPWLCFPFTFDESYFIQAIVRWAEGAGYRLHGVAKPFDPAITVGIPVAWGTAWIHQTFGVDWPQAGRLFVHGCFYALLATLVVYSLRQWRNPFAALVSLAFYGKCVSSAPAGPYLVFGLLGEIPGAWVAFFSLWALRTGAGGLAGALAILSFILKPTYAILFPAALLAQSLVAGVRREGEKSAVAFAVSGVLTLALY